MLPAPGFALTEESYPALTQGLDDVMAHYNELEVLLSTNFKELREVAAEAACIKSKEWQQVADATSRGPLGPLYANLFGVLDSQADLAMEQSFL